jgi:type II secretory pathway component GspD/PulD (secretin)
MSTRFFSLALIVALLPIHAGAYSQDPSSSKNKRILYVAKHGDAKKLAAVLAKHFKGDAEIDALEEPSSNCLLISAAPGVIQELVKMLDQLDQRPKVISIELLVADVAVAKGDDGKPVIKEFDPKELSGPSKDVLDKVERLHKKGVFSELRRIELSVLDGRATKVSTAASTPYVTGMMSKGGVVSRLFRLANTGTETKITARLTSENDVALELMVTDVTLKPQEGVSIGKDPDTGTAIPAMAIVTSTLDSKINIASGHAQLVQGVKTESKTSAQTLMIATARALDVGGKGSK